MELLLSCHPYRRITYSGGTLITISFRYQSAHHNSEPHSTYLPEPETKESWNMLDDATVEQFKKSRFSEWDFGVGEVIKKSSKMLRVSMSTSQAFTKLTACATVCII